MASGQLAITLPGWQHMRPGQAVCASTWLEYKNGIYLAITRRSATSRLHSANASTCGSMGNLFV